MCGNNYHFIVSNWFYGLLLDLSQFSMNLSQRPSHCTLNIFLVVTQIQCFTKDIITSMSAISCHRFYVQGQYEFSECRCSLLTSMSNAFLCVGNWRVSRTRMSVVIKAAVKRPINILLQHCNMYGIWDKIPTNLCFIYIKFWLILCSPTDHQFSLLIFLERQNLEVKIKVFSSPDSTKVSFTTLQLIPRWSLEYVSYI